MTSDLVRRLDRIAAGFRARTTVLVQEDGTQAFLPRAAALDLFLAFGRINHDDAFVLRDGTPPPSEWIQAFARSVPTSGEGQLTETVRIWCQELLTGKEPA